MVVSNKVLAFKVAYILGVEDNVLKRDYEEDYEVSKQLKLFDKVEDAFKLRCLSRARISVIRYNNLYEGNKDLKQITGQYLATEIEFLKEQGIDLVKLYSDNNELDYFNILTKHIDKLKLKVLKELNIPRAEIIQEFFYFPILDSKLFKSFLKVFKTLSCPHGMIFYNGVKIKQSLSFSLLNNKNLYFSAYSMQSKRYDGKLELETGFSWDTVLEENSVNYQLPSKFIEALQKKAKSLSNQPLESIIPGVVKEDKPTLVKENKPKDNKIVKEVPYVNSIPLVDKGMEKFIKQGTTEIFVDCDNSDFFKVVNFLRVLEGSKQIKAVRLIVDLKSNFLWKVFKDLYGGTIPVSIVKVQRIKENKSVADVVLTKEVCEGYYTRKLRQAIVVSSDSDFFGLITSLPDINYCIAYTDGQMNDEYLKYLEDNNVTTYDLTELDSEEVLEHYKDICIEYLLAYTLAQTPVSKWEVSNICNIVEFHLRKETDLEIEDKYVESKIKSLMESVKVEIKSTSTLITVNSIVIDASLL